MTVMVKKGLVDANPFNPKHPLTKEEKDFLNNSLSEHGMIGGFVLIPSFYSPGRFIILDGHDRIEMVDNDEIEAFIYSKPILNENDLKKLTLDYCTTMKKQNKKQLYSFYSALGFEGLENYNKIFETDINIDVEKIKKEAKLPEFYEIKTFVFKNEKSFETFKILHKKLKDKIFTNPKTLEFLEKQIDQVDIEKYFFDVLLK
jgi:hypothetical protein